MFVTFTELEQRNSNPIFPRETKITNSPSLASSNRFLAGALDQRIMKQSSEDCRRLLQQVNG